MIEVLNYLIVIVALWYTLVILFLLRGFLSIRPSGEPHNNYFSVVIAARNEENHIRECLRSVLSQSIPPDRYEVIVVDDRSTDATASIVSEFTSTYLNVILCSITSTPQGISPKKYAVSQGVLKAKNEIIVFTDADCRVPEKWLDTIDRHFSPGVGLVQGITSYHYVQGMNKLFFGLQSIDFISHGIVAAAAIGAELPINSNANNFAFRADAFRAAGGVLSEIGHVVSGDDDLLLQKIWKQKKWKIKFMIERAGAVSTTPTKTVAGVFQQRARWGSKTVHYNSYQVLLLFGIFLFYVTLLLLLCIVPWNRSFVYPLLFLMMIKLIGEAVLMVPGLAKYGKTALLPLLPVASLLQLPLVVLAVLSGVFGKFRWKGQTFSRTIR